MREKPEYAKEEHFEFLNELRLSGKVNMFGARPNLMRKFPYLNGDQALDILTYWMETF